ncbi:hypothetical protein AAMO2058_000808200 [Amorphochlora amoebiformis]
MSLQPFVALVLFSFPVAGLLSDDPPSGTNVPASFDCAARRLALEYATSIQPRRTKEDFRMLAAELSLPGGLPGGLTQCTNITYEGPDHVFPRTYRLPEGPAVFADKLCGDDHADGTYMRPYKTVKRALEGLRKIRSTGVTHGTIVLRTGVYYLEDTLSFYANDSGITLQSYNGEKAVVSGGALIENLDWQPVDGKANTFAAKIPAASGISEITGLRIDRRRAVRARFPNGCKDTQHNLPSGYLCKGTAPDGGVVTPIDGFGSNALAKSWIPSSKPTMNSTKTFVLSSPVRSSGVTFRNYQLGYGGSCNIFDPPSGYWCGNRCAGGAPSPPNCIYRTMGGFEYSRDTLPNTPYKDPSGGVVQVWHPGHWASWMFEIDSEMSNDTHIMFSKGGFQGGRGNNKGEAFFVENVIEELDAANEFFFNSSTRTLYYNTGTNSPPDASALIEATNLKTIFSFEGSMNNTVSGIRIRGLHFRDAALDYLGPHLMPSGGDWALGKTASIEAEGVEGLVIEGCDFRQLDGNAVLIHGYARDVSIVENRFDEIGGSIISQLGYTKGAPEEAGFGMGPDGTSGEQPRGTRIEYNFATRCGLFEKQSSFYFQAKSCQNLVRNNIFFHGPRAGINFNDGFGGGSLVEGNLLFNTVMETGDHGPFNSWDRQPFITKVKDGVTPQLEKAFDEIRNNFIMGNYYSQEGIDNDDGSSYYNTHHNFFVYARAGMKNDFGGHDNYHHSNVYAYHSRGAGINGALRTHQDRFYLNKVILTNSNGYIKYDCKCNTTSSCPDLHANEIYTYDGTMLDICGQDLKERQNLGYDIGTTVSKWPSDEQIIYWGRSLLGLF